MENLRREASQPFVPSGTLELYFPALLHRWVPAFGTPFTRAPAGHLLTCPRVAEMWAGLGSSWAVCVCVCWGGEVSCSPG